MLGLSPLKDTEWLVTRVELRLVLDPYEVDEPYSTCEVAPTSVVQVTVALALVIELVLTFEITGPKDEEDAESFRT